MVKFFELERSISENQIKVLKQQLKFKLPFSIGNADLPLNIRLLDDHFHFKIHHAKGFYTPWLW
jgi:hypothetical protein